MPKGYEVARVAVKSGDRLRAALPRNARHRGARRARQGPDDRAIRGAPGEPTAFVIGGADGLDPPSSRSEAALLLRLSALTLPHALAQVVLLEQLYRAATLLTGHPYHRE